MNIFHTHCFDNARRDSNAIQVIVVCFRFVFIMFLIIHSYYSQVYAQEGNREMTDSLVGLRSASYAAEMCNEDSPQLSKERLLQIIRGKEIKRKNHQMKQKQKKMLPPKMRKVDELTIFCSFHR